MSQQEALFNEIGSKLKDAEKSQMFGKPCFKINGKAFICLFDNEMVFKLQGDIKAEALKLKGSKQFDPSGRNRPMKEWIQVGFKHSEKWGYFSREALDYIKALSSK